MRIFLTIISITCTLAGVFSATACHDPFDPRFELGKVQDRALDTFVYDQMIQQKMVGFGLAVVVAGRPAYVRGFGYEDWDSKTETDPKQTRFRWASSSKTVTGALAALHASEGRVDLDKDIRSYYRRYQKEGVTLRRLLSHTAGVMHYGNGSLDPEPSGSDLGNPDINTGIEWALYRWIDEPLLFTPGTRYSYSTPGFNLAGVVLEYATQKDVTFWDLVWGDLLLLFDVQHMQPDYGWAKIPHRATGYVVPGPDADEVYEDDNTDVSWKLPGGGFISTAEDAAYYCAGILGPYYPQAARDILWAPSRLSSGEEVGYGLGWRLDSRDGRWQVSHGGYQEKAESLIIAYPAERLCLMGLSNTRGEDGSDGAVNLEPILNGIEDRIRVRLAVGQEAIQDKTADEGTNVEQGLNVPSLAALRDTLSKLIKTDGEKPPSP